MATNAVDAVAELEVTTQLAKNAQKMKSTRTWEQGCGNGMGINEGEIKGRI